MTTRLTCSTDGTIRFNGMAVGSITTTSPVIHAVDAEGMTFSPTLVLASRCGAHVDRLIPVPVADKEGTEWTAPLPWPPRVADLPDPWTRCAECIRPGERPGRRNRIIG